MKTLRETFEKILEHCTNNAVSDGDPRYDPEGLTEKEALKALLLAVTEHVKDKSLQFMEPCEPDCDEVRHAEHHGSWMHMTRMDEWADSLLESEEQ